MLMIGVLHILVRLIRVFVLMCARLSVYSRNVVPLCFVFLFCCVCVLQMGVLASKIQIKMPPTVNLRQEATKLAEDVQWGSR